MTGWASIFVVIALMSAVLGFAGVAAVSTSGAWVLFLCGVVFAMAFFGSEKNPRT